MSSTPDTTQSQSQMPTSFSQGRPQAFPFKIGPRSSLSKVIQSKGLTITIPDCYDLYKGLSKTPICSIDRPTLEVGDEVIAELTEFRAVAAYNWEDHTEPHILVPGFPRIWQYRSLPFTIPRDSVKKKVFVDQNSCRLAASPLTPLIVAVNHYDPKFRMGEMDFITDRNNLRKLYRWISQSFKTQNPLAEAFRIDVGLVGNSKTILFQRWEVDSTQPGGPGYAKNFQDHTTYQIEENTTGYHRIIAFKFGDKQILMRSTTDACLPFKRDDTSSLIDELTSKFTSFNLENTPNTKKVATSENDFLTVQTVGELCSQESLLELKTKGSWNNPTNYDDLYVQLLFANVPNVYTGRHRSGVFYEVEEDTLSSIKEKKTEAVQRNLKLLKKVLDEIQQVAFENLKDGGSLSLVLRQGDAMKLEVLKREEKDGLLPENILAYIN